ncbi:hydantoinase/oxoprolinase family protein [Streptomyces sp. Lzd4kr]|nr:hydantoinase/oxoprolinase family protein [Streptomyces sp. Lzd4kr]
MRISTDMGGTFTDLVVEHPDGHVQLFKSPTTPSEPLRGVLNAVRLAADALEVSLAELLADTDTFIHGTTRSLNALLTGQTARTALLTTEGHPDILLFREGGRAAPFDFTRPYPRPWVPRNLTFEIPGRIGADGRQVRPLDEAAVKNVLRQLRDSGIEAIAVCLLWSIVNPAHEERVAELIADHLPDVPFTLSHRLNPIVREYRRASSTALDASLKPLMATYLHQLGESLREEGFAGRLLINTSAGGVQDAADVTAAPIHTLNSGPSMAPVAGRHYAARDVGSQLAIVADTGGTSYDVSIVRHGRIPLTQEAWIGDRHLGHMTGFPGVDVRSVGAGGGSIAWVDGGGMLRVGPRSAGSEPGPACYGRGGTEPTVTDACLTLGYIDAGYFLGGRMILDTQAAHRAVREHVADPLGLSLHEAAAAIMAVTTEHMVGAIEEITLNQGIAPDEAVLIGGGGAAGFNSVAIARRLHCRQVVMPALGAVLSAGGALMSDLSSEYVRTVQTTTEHFAFEEVNAALTALLADCGRFQDGPGARAVRTSVELLAGARYPSQVWELEIPLTVEKFSTPEDVREFKEAFHAVHEDMFAINDPGSEVEIVSWRARVRCRIHDRDPMPTAHTGAERPIVRRPVYRPGVGMVDVPVVPLDRLEIDRQIPGPMIIESPVSTIVVDDDAHVTRSPSGSVIITLSDHPAVTS